MQINDIPNFYSELKLIAIVPSEIQEAHRYFKFDRSRCLAKERVVKH